ncbi:MAG TPA: hypothetical protein VK465_06315 [Fibrobacteria bacterium]|nr:hypothetical protein [Fibrobacteria bacterium]
MKLKEAPLAGYLMARSAMHQKVEGQDLKNLRAGNETVQQVSELMPLGRANVVQDIAIAKDIHLPLRKDAANKLAEDLLFNHLRHGRDLTEDDINGTIAAAAQYAKTGTCGDFASNTTALHAAKLADMQDERAVVSHAGHKTVDHGWSEFLPKGTNADGTLILHGKDVIMDGWGVNNHAIFREDCKFARLDQDGKADQIKHDDPLNHRSGPEALKVLEKYKAQIENSPHFQDVFKTEFDRLVKEKHEWPKGSFWSATNIIHPEFQIRASAALHKDAKHVRDANDVQEAAKHAPDAKESRIKKIFRGRAEQAKRNNVRNRAEQVKHASLAEIQAIGVARSLGSNIRGAIEEASGIVASAKEMFPRPEYRLPA